MLRSVKELQGYAVVGKDGELGHVEDFYFDDSDWAVRYLVVNTGNWLVGRWTLISPDATGTPDVEARTLPVELTREQVENGPNIEKDKPVSRQKEMELVNYYNWPTYWDRLTGTVGPDPASVSVQAAKVAEKEEGLPGDPNLRSTDEVIGYHLQARDGEIGHIEDFIVEGDTWDIQYVLVDTRNWLPGKQVLISPSWIVWVRWDSSEVKVDLQRDTIQNSPEFDPSLLDQQ